jgi:hypothetical protein
MASSGPIAIISASMSLIVALPLNHLKRLVAGLSRDSAAHELRKRA